MIIIHYNPSYHHRSLNISIGPFFHDPSGIQRPPGPRSNGEVTGSAATGASVTCAPACGRQRKRHRSGGVRRNGGSVQRKKYRISAKNGWIYMESTGIFKLRVVKTWWCLMFWLVAPWPRNLRCFFSGWISKSKFLPAKLWIVGSTTLPKPCFFYGCRQQRTGFNHNMWRFHQENWDWTSKH